MDYPKTTTKDLTKTTAEESNCIDYIISDCSIWNDIVLGVPHVSCPMGSVFIVGHHRWLHIFSLWYSQICFTNSFFKNLAVDKCLTFFYLSYKECLTCINQRLGGFFFKQGWYLLNERINNCYLFSNIPRNWLSCRAVGDIITRREVNINAIEECNCYHHHHSCR